MITRYNTPSESNLQQTYVPIPFDQMMEAGKVMAQQYETGMDALQKVYDDTYNIKYIPGSRDEQYVKQQVIPAAKEVFTKYISQDMGNPIVRRQALMDLNSKIDKNKIQKIQESWGGWSENQKWRQKLGAEGKYNKLLDTSDLGYDTDSMGVYSKLTPAQLDTQTKKENYFDDLETSSYIDKNTGVLIEYINDSQIKHLAKSNYSDYKKSAEGKQDIQLYRINTNDTETSDDVIAYNLLYKAGQEKKRYKEHGIAPGYSKKDSQNNNVTNPYISRDRSPMVDLSRRYKYGVEDFKGKPITKLQLVTTGGSGPSGPTMSWKEVPTGEIEYKNNLLDKPEVSTIVQGFSKDLKSKVDKIKNDKFKKDNPKLYKQYQQEVFGKLEKIYDQVASNLQEAGYVNTFYPEEQENIPETKWKNSKSMTDLLFSGAKPGDQVKTIGIGNFINHKWIKVPKKGMPEVVSGQQLYEHLDPEATVAVTGDFDYRHPFYVLSGKNKDFLNPLQVTIGGEQYVASGPENLFPDKNWNFKKGLAQTYSDLTYNEGQEQVVEYYPGSNIPKTVGIYITKETNGKKPGYYLRDTQTGQTINTGYDPLTGLEREGSSDFGTAYEYLDNYNRSLKK